MNLDNDPRLQTDLLLLGRIAERDRAAFCRMFEERGPAILGVLCRVLDKVEAEEVLVDVFGAVWEKAPSFQPNGTSPFGWMLGLAKARAAERLQALRASRGGDRISRSSAAPRSSSTSGSGRGWS